MNALRALAVAVVAAVTLTAVAAAHPNAAKQRVAIDMAGGQSFVLIPLQPGALKRDSGPVDRQPPGRPFLHATGPESLDSININYTLSGKQGNMTIQERNEWVDVSQKNARGFDYRPGVAIGNVEDREWDRRVRQGRRRRAERPCRHGEAVVHPPGGLPHGSLVAPDGSSVAVCGGLQGEGASAPSPFLAGRASPRYPHRCRPGDRGRAASATRSRKVRTPQGRTLGKPQTAKADGQWHRKETAGASASVRVKGWGKSPPAPW